MYQLLYTILFRVFHYSSRPSSHRSPRKTFGVVAPEDKYAARVNRSTAATTTKIFMPFVAVSKSPAVTVRPPYASSLITRAREQNVFYTPAATDAFPPLSVGADFRSGKSFGPRLGGRKRSSRGGGGVRGVD